MDEDTFFRELEQLPLKGWKALLQDSGEIRLTHPTWVRGAIPPYCPVTAVYAQRIGRRHGNDRYRIAARRLELEQEFADQVAMAADGRRCGALRERLLKCLHLI